jgi:hypothetical protein
MCGRTFKNARGCRQHARIMSRKEPGKHRSGGKMHDTAEYMAEALLRRALVPDYDPFNEQADTTYPK